MSLIKKFIYLTMSIVFVFLPLFYVLDYAGDYIDNRINTDDGSYETQSE